MLCTGDLDCLAPTAAVCDLAATRMCVQCTQAEAGACTGGTPICNTDDTCRGCTGDDECTSSKVCDVPSGACTAEDAVLYVAPAGTGTTCTQAQPCGELATALALVTADRKTIKLLAGSYTERVTIADTAVAIHADGADLSEASTGEVVRITGAADVTLLGLRIHDGLGGLGDGILCASSGGQVPTLALQRVAIEHNGGAGINATNCSLTMSGSTVTGNQGVGVSASGGSLTMTGSTVTGNQGVGVSASGGSVTASRCEISANSGGGVSVMNGAFDITNSFITRNGNPSTSPVGGASLSVSPATVNRFEFNTVVDNTVENGGFRAGGVACDGIGFTAPNNVIARNFINNDPAQSSSNTNGTCTYPTSVVATTVALLKFKSPDDVPYDYHLTMGSSAVDQATTPSMISLDYDGDPRPQGPASDQGADELTSQ
jgi:hypothetical protein